LPYYKKFVVLDKQKHFVNEHVYQNETASMKQRQNRAQITASTYQN